ncbi:acetyl-CoA carboxylase biotin carboxylase subunit [Myxococcota bacterium]|nr:acetyl-CoA carboxylase biotin carboxylase subunit [Myxococcota bacterium]MBU1429230.1 acetyl-CoA carboxylase biotin carboxylase subunit [Myxococcota bacterium]MBU1900214.1 acetyl-CoA carboxylase biotin carboxylase subunit [Myxococcota bacterium]
MFKRVLVANRGEIAVRVTRTLIEMGITPLAIYSEADAHALHVQLAAEALCVGPEASAESYLVGSRVIAAALELGAEAIHPGYGFLSENAGFARAVMAAGLTWIGPPPEAIEAMGDKLTARRVVEAAGVPVVPGVSRPMRDAEEAAAIAEEIGYPVMLKASAGGGGKGMRLVHDKAALIAGLAAARREAAGAFGDDAVYIEKFVTEPHHIEVQVFCDAHGACVHFGERECSVQRRHQKVIEEAPSPFISEALRQEMGAVAVAAARACGYVGAGTVEFLVGGDQRFYFLEMNTRLQVEHPVTELVYGVDLVELQLRVAAGAPLPMTQAEITPRGHAIECRVYAEDPDTWLPAPGAITALRWPSGPGVRIDAGVQDHSVVSAAYDPMIAKLCVWAADRDKAIARARRALRETAILGITTNLALHRRVMDDARFIQGRYDTGMLSAPLSPCADEAEDDTLLLIAAALDQRARDLEIRQRARCASGALSPWRRQGGAGGRL